MPSKPKSGKPKIADVFLSLQSDLRQYLLRFLVRKEDVEDALQEAYIRSVKAEGRSEIRSPRAFLYKVVKNVALSEISKKRHKVISYIEDFEALNVIDSTSCVEDNEIQRQELAAFLDNVVQALPPKCAEVFLLRKAYGFSHKEIAKKLSISVSTVEKHLIKGSQRYEQYVQTKSAAEKSSISAGSIDESKSDSLRR